jgi:4-hydroxy-tetrahydrodipicolinate synthase
MTSPWPLGLMTALVTPLKNDALDVVALTALIERQVAAGVGGLVIGGGTGEYVSLSIEERIELAHEAIRIVDGRVPVVVQTGALTNRGSVTLSRDAQDAGARAVLVASPYGDPINWRERYHFYEQVSAAVSLPIMVYNTPPSGLLTLTQIQQLATLPNISAVKDSSGDPVLMGDLIAWSAMREEDFGVYVGLDSFLFDAIGSGARGAVFGSASVIPEILVRIIGTLQSVGQTAQLRSQWNLLRPFIRFMEDTPNYVALCKAACTIQGIDVGAAREPYLMPEPAELAELELQLKKVDQLFGPA